MLSFGAMRQKLFCLKWGFLILHIYKGLKKSMETHVQVRVAGLICENGKLLVMHYNYPNGRIHAIPGGRMEQGEFAPEALRREYMEELGLEVEIGPLLFVGEMFAKEKMKQTMHLVFATKILAGVPVLNPDETSANGVGWIALADLADYHLYPDIGDAIQGNGDEAKTATYLGNVMSRKWM